MSNANAETFYAKQNDDDWQYRNISTVSTTVVKSGKGTLRSVVVGLRGTVASAVVIYDNTSGSGNQIARIDSLNLHGMFEFNVKFTTGLTIVTTGTVAPNITVVYK